MIKKSNWNSLFKKLITRINKLDYHTSTTIYSEISRLISKENAVSRNDLLYYEYTSLRRNSKMKVVSHFKEDGPTIQKVIEELLLECCTVN